MNVWPKLGSDLIELNAAFGSFSKAIGLAFLLAYSFKAERAALDGGGQISKTNPWL